MRNMKETRICPVCRGSGKKVVYVKVTDDRQIEKITTTKEDCPTCNGRGIV